MRKLLTLMVAVLAAITVQAAETVYYTLTPATGTNSNYASNCDITISDITWNLTGNSQMQPWRLGGKNISNTNRALYSKTAMGSAISKIEMQIGSITCTLNSFRLEVASDASFNTIIDTVTKSVSQNSTVSITPSSGSEWASSAYYRFTFNVTCGSSNQFVQFTNAKFYKNDGGSQTAVATPTFSPAEGTYTSTQNVTINCATSGATIHYTTDGTTPTGSSTTYSGAISVSSTTTIKAIAIVGTTVSEVASATYTINSGGSDAGVYTLVTDASVLTAGDEIIIASAGAAGSAYAIANTTKADNRAATAVTISSGLTIEPTSTTEIFNLVGSSGEWSFQATGTTYNGEYLYASSASANQLKYRTDITTAAQATITISNGSASVVFNDNDVRNVMRYNPNNGSPLFACYTSSSSTGNLVYLYRKASNTVATPTFSPATGTYTSEQSVTISCATSGATIHYTTDGSTPTASSATYSSAIAVSETTTIKAIAVKGGMTDSEVATATYTIEIPVTTTTYTKVTNSSGLVAGDKYLLVYETTPAVNGEISSNKLAAVSGAGISLSGTSLSVSSSASVVPITLVATSDADYWSFKIDTSNYLISNSSGQLSTNSNAGANGAWWGVTFSGGNAMINNKDYDTFFLRYNASTFAAIGSSSGSAIQLYREGDTGNEISSVATPVISPAGGNITEATNVSISCSTNEATIYYTTDGTTPTSASTPYVGPLSVSQTTTIKAIAIFEDISSSVATAEFTYTGSAVSNVFELVTSDTDLVAGGEYIIVQADHKLVAGAYNSSNSTRTGISTGFSYADNKITVTGSDISVFTLGGSSGEWTLHDGTYYLGTSGSSGITDDSTDFVITIASDTYYATITVSGSTRSIFSNGSQFKNYANSNLGSGTYQAIQLFKRSTGGSTPTEQVETPVISPADGTTITGPTSVSITCATSGATIYYTTDGSTPTSSSTEYTAAFTVSATTTVKAIAVKSGMTDSEVATATFTYQSASTNDEYTLVTDASTLASGDVVIIASNGAGEVMTAGKAGNSSTLAGSSTDVTFSSDKSTVTLGDDAEAVVLVLEGSSGAWTFRSGTNYMVASSSSNSITMTTNSATHTITIGSNATATIKSGSGSRFLQYNSGTSPTRFGSYESSFTGTNKEVQIYRQVAAASTVTTLTGIAAFKTATAGETVRLYLPDSYNARVMHATLTATNNSNGTYTYDAYVRDNSGSLLLKGLVTTREMAHDQHIAGWLMGQYTIESNGMPQLTPALNTTGDRSHCPWFIIADPVTETATEPLEIEADGIYDHLADWVKVTDLDQDSGVTLTNAFSTTGYTAPYSGAIYDVSAIAAAATTLYPVAYNDVPIVTYVIDANKDFVSPSSNISGTTVRFVRDFTSGTWTPLTVPFTFDLEDFDGVVMEYVGLEQGDDITGNNGRTYETGKMIFEEATSIVAGQPYLVKTYDGMSEMTFTGVTLSNSDAKSVTNSINVSSSYSPMRRISANDEYTLTGTYSPTTVSATDLSYKVFTSNGSVTWARDAGGNVAGTGAYITSPAAQGIQLAMGDDTSSVITGICDIDSDQRTYPEGTYNLLGIKMTGDWQSLPPGIYIVNGKKMMKGRE